MSIIDIKICSEWAVVDVTNIKNETTGIIYDINNNNVPSDVRHNFYKQIMSSNILTAKLPNNKRKFSEENQQPVIFKPSIFKPPQPSYPHPYLLLQSDPEQILNTEISTQDEFASSHQLLKEQEKSMRKKLLERQHSLKTKHLSEKKSKEQEEFLKNQLFEEYLTKERLVAEQSIKKQLMDEEFLKKQNDCSSGGSSSSNTITDKIHDYEACKSYKFNFGNLYTIPCNVCSNYKNKKNIHMLKFCTNMCTRDVCLRDDIHILKECKYGMRRNLLDYTPQSFLLKKYKPESIELVP